MATWLEDIQQALRSLGGSAHYANLYEALGVLRGAKLSKVDEATVRKEIERCSSASDNWRPGRPNLFRSVDGKGKGVWGLVEDNTGRPDQASANLESNETIVGDVGHVPEKREYLRELVLRKSRPVLALKQLYGGRCQISGKPVMNGIAGDITEAHHIHWLTRGGSDSERNMVIISPTFHAAIHAVDAVFDWLDLSFSIGGERFPLLLNKHLKPSSSQNTQ